MSIGSMKGIRRDLGLQALRSRPATRRGAPRRSSPAPPRAAAISSGRGRRNATRRASARLHGAAHRNIGRRARGRIAGAADALALRPRQACAWRDRAIPDRRGTGRRIRRGSERSGTHPRCRPRPAPVALPPRLRSGAAACRLRRTSCCREAPCRACRLRGGSAARPCRRAGC